MAEKSGIVKEIATGLPAWAKGIIAVGVIGGGAYLIYKLVKKGKDILKPDEAKKDVKELEQAGQVASYMDAQYIGFADAIYSARAGNNIFGTDEDSIYNVFMKMKNNLDVAKLITAFGVRRLSYSFSEASLGGFLQDDLDSEEIDTINTILSKKGITYKF